MRELGRFCVASAGACLLAALMPAGAAPAAGAAASTARRASRGAARTRSGRPVRRHPGTPQCDYRRGGRARRAHDADFGIGQTHRRPGSGSHRGHRRAAARPRVAVERGVRGLVFAERQRRNDRHHLGRRVGLPGRPRHDHQHSQRRGGSRRHDPVARRARRRRFDRLLVVPSGGRRNLGRLVERRQRLSRQAGACVRGARFGACRRAWKKAAWAAVPE